MNEHSGSNVTVIAYSCDSFILKMSAMGYSALARIHIIFVFCVKVIVFPSSSNLYNFLKVEMGKKRVKDRASREEDDIELTGNYQVPPSS